MKMREIINTTSSTGYPESHQHKFPVDISEIPAFEGLIFKEYMDGFGTHHLGLFADDKLVSYLELDIRNTEYYQITYSATSEKYQRRGCFRFLLNKAVEQHRTVLSDSHHTPEAKAAWKSLIQYPSGIIKICAYDVRTGDKKPAKGVDRDSIWNDEEEPVLMITNSEFSEEYLQRAKREHRGLIECGRDYKGIWYGVRSSNDHYDNP
jgi:hypothetical protein